MALARAHYDCHSSDAYRTAGLHNESRHAQAVRAEMARALAGWLLTDVADAADAAAVAACEQRALALPALPPDARAHHLQAAAAALGAVLG